MVSVITKAGTNQFHGSAYEYYQGSNFNANDFFNNAQRIPLTSYSQSILGGSLGGRAAEYPEYSTAITSTFFFADIEFTPYRSGGAVAKGVVPTAAMTKGDFSGDQTIVCEPINRNSVCREQGSRK